jgi:hypothetical protein
MLIYFDDYMIFSIIGHLRYFSYFRDFEWPGDLQWEHHKTMSYGIANILNTIITVIYCSHITNEFRRIRKSKRYDKLNCDIICYHTEKGFPYHHYYILIPIIITIYWSLSSLRHQLRKYLRMFGQMSKQNLIKQMQYLFYVLRFMQI